MPPEPDCRDRPLAGAPAQEGAPGPARPIYQAAARPAGAREDGGEGDVRRRLRQPGGEERVAERAVDEVADELAEGVAEELDRGEDEEDQPEAPNDEAGCRGGFGYMVAFGLNPCEFRDCLASFLD